MNKNIKEILEKVHPTSHDDDGDPMTTVLMPSAIEEFAELIVRDCAEIARLNTRVDSKVYLMIKEHFGVEE